MMSLTLLYTLQELCNYLPYLYVLMFILGIGIHKQLSSLSIIIILMACAEFIMDTTGSSLLKALSNRGLADGVGMSIWALFWCYLYAMAVLVFEKSHHWLNLSKGRELITIQALFGLATVIQIIDFVNIMVFQIQAIYIVYEAGIPLIGLAIGVYLLAELLLSIKDNYFVSHTVSDAI